MKKDRVARAHLRPAAAHAHTPPEEHLQAAGTAATTSAAAALVAALTLTCGDQVFALWCGSWYAATIVALNTNGSCAGSYI